MLLLIILKYKVARLSNNKITGKARPHFRTRDFHNAGKRIKKRDCRTNPCSGKQRVISAK